MQGTIIQKKLFYLYASREEANCDTSTVCLPCVSVNFLLALIFYISFFEAVAERKAPAPLLQYVRVISVGLVAFP